MTETTVVRAFQAEDWPAICEIHDLARPDELRGSCDPRAFVPIAEDPEIEDLRACVKHVAEVGEQIVGFVGIDGDYVAWLYVHPAYHGRGVGRRLLRAGLNLVKGRAWTIVLSGNVPAIRLYESEGFRETRRFHSDNAGYPCTCIRMERRLQDLRDRCVSDSGGSMGLEVINLGEKLSQFSDHWAPRIVAQLNDYHVKLAKIQGQFVWHSHEDTDELFFVIQGHLTIAFRDGGRDEGEVHLKSGEMCVVPRGVEHKPIADEECHILLVEPAGTVNTGDAGGDLTSDSDLWI